ncbi:hypothetical protein KY289_001208 [Solanum tuberosum]|nr:hypothetical protein KY289_001208 [Solanum tuberosum]
MAALFGYADESVFDRQLEWKKSELMLNSYKMLEADSDMSVSFWCFHMVTLPLASPSIYHQRTTSASITHVFERNLGFIFPLISIEASSFACLDLSNCKVLVCVKKDLKEHSTGPTSILCDVLHISTTLCAIEEVLANSFILTGLVVIAAKTPSVTGKDELEAELKELEEQLLQPASTVPTAPDHVPAGKQPAWPIP